MHGVAERVKDGRHVGIYAAAVYPDIRHWQRQIFGKSARPVDADALGICAKVSPARQTIAAMTAHDVPLAANDLAREEIYYVVADLNYLADKFMTDHERDANGFSRPRI